MRDCRDRYTRRIHRALQLVERTEHSRFKFRSEFFCTRQIGIKNSRKRRAFNFVVNARVIAAKLSAADNGHTNSSVVRDCAHSLFIPFAAALGSAATGKASM